MAFYFPYIYLNRLFGSSCLSDAGFCFPKILVPSTHLDKPAHFSQSLQNVYSHGVVILLLWRWIEGAESLCWLGVHLCRWGAIRCWQCQLLPYNCHWLCASHLHRSWEERLHVLDGADQTGLQQHQRWRKTPKEIGKCTSVCTNAAMQQEEQEWPATDLNNHNPFTCHLRHFFFFVRA